KTTRGLVTRICNAGEPTEQIVLIHRAFFVVGNFSIHLFRSRYIRVLITRFLNDFAIQAWKSIKHIFSAVFKNPNKNWKFAWQKLTLYIIPNPKPKHYLPINLEMLRIRRLKKLRYPRTRSDNKFVCAVNRSISPDYNSFIEPIRIDSEHPFINLKL